MRFWMAGWALAAAAAFAQPPVEHFFKPPTFGQLVLSPDGKYIAALSPVNERRNLVVIDLATRKPKALTAFKTRDVTSVRWVNNDRLVLTTGSIGVEAFQSRGGGVYAIKRDGTEGRLLAEGGADEAWTPGVRAVFRVVDVVRTLPGGGDDIIGQEFAIDAERTRAGDLLRIDTRTGRRTVLSVGKPDQGENEAWIVDNDGVPRAFMAVSAGRVRVYYRAGPDAPWKKLDERSTTTPGFTPLALGEDGKTLVVADNRNRDKAALVRYDPQTGTFGEVLARHPQVDLTDVVQERGRVVGVRFQADRGGAAWFDEQLARLQAAVDAAFPDNVNVISWSLDRSRVLVFSYSDRSPGAYYLLDPKAAKMEWLLDRAPWIKPEEMAAMRPVRYKARDGLEIPAYLTLPASGPAKRLPLVVMVHGGPWVPGDMWAFHPEVQFLASRGYAVLQPNFRGTTRYGWKHFASSFGQWGLAMQDDVADGVLWAAEQGIADRDRVCIYGGSYGGYATMMGLARHPDLYRCGINYVGVTDMELFLTATWSDYAYSDAVEHSIKEMVGDMARDRERLMATSPVNLAARIKAPVMMAYGAVDFRVPIEHGTRMRAALERHGNTPVWMVAEGEGHGFSDLRNQRRFYEAMERFLAKHLGAP